MRKLKENTSLQRRCTRCKEIKPLTDFRNNKLKQYGKSYVCRPCDNVNYLKRMATYKETETWKAIHSKAVAKYRKSYPEKALAHRLAKKHKSELLKAQCENCGSIGALHMHHSDYSKPLDVVTLCIPCHQAVHKELA